MLLLLSLAVFATITILKPNYGLGIILALLPSYLIRFNLLGIPSTLLEMLIIVFVAVVIALHPNFSDWVKIKRLGLVNWAIMLFIFSGIVSTIISPEPIKALGQLKAFFIEPVLLFYASIIILPDKKLLSVPLKFLLGSAGLISLFGIIQYYTHLFLPLRFWGYGPEVKRITSVFEYPNALALFLTPIIALSVVLFIEKTFSRKCTLLATVLMTIATLLTYSRGAWLALAVTGLVLAVRYNGLVKVNLKTVIAFILLICLGVFLTYGRITSTFHDSSSSERGKLLQVGIGEVIKNPILGNGLYGFRTTLEQSNYTGEILNYPHNIFLNFWLETGLIGLLSFFGVLYLVFREVKKNGSIFKYAGVFALAAMIIHGLVDVPYFKNDLSVLFWFLISMFYIKD